MHDPMRANLLSPTYVVLRAEVLRERGGQDLATDRGGRSEMRLARLAARGGDVCTMVLALLK